MLQTRERTIINPMDTKQVGLSIIVPLFNEEEVLSFLYERLINALKGLPGPYEIIFVDDGSSDKTLSILKEFSRINKNIKLLSFSRNFGHQIAITAGLNFSSGKAVIVIDGDLQDPPEIIAKFIEKWEEGYKVVYGVRTKRKEGIFKVAIYSCYYRILQKLANIDMPLDSGDFCLMDRSVVDLLNKIPERNRFVRGIRCWVGFKQIGLEYERGPRYKGKCKYTIFKLLQLGLNGIISFSGVPLKASIFAGSFVSLFSIIYSLTIVINRLFYPQQQIPGWTSIVVAVTFLGGIQLVALGIIGEYILRIFDEVKRRPLYILETVIGFESEDAKNISYNPCP